MAFGDNYQPVYEIPMLEDGEYLARIDKVTLDTYPSGDEYASVKVSIKDHPNTNPSIFFLNSIPKIGQVKANGQPVTEEDYKRACRTQTTFFECFGIPVGNFDITTWKGHTGTVKIAPSYDKNEPDKKSKVYKTIYPQKPKAQTAQPQSTQPMKVQSVTQITPDNFPEDIPNF